MKVCTSSLTLLHNPPNEILSGELQPYLESPERIRVISAALSKDTECCFEFVEVDEELDVVDHVLRVHTPAYVSYMENAYANWVKAGNSEVQSSSAAHQEA